MTTDQQIELYTRIRNHLSLARAEMATDTHAKWSKAMRVLKQSETRCSVLLQGLRDGKIDLEADQ